MSIDKRRHQCPKCHRNDCLWQSVSIYGWVNVDEYLEIDPGTLDHDSDYDDGYTFGCGECGWEGVEAGLIELGIDDQPLPVIHPNQMRFGEAA